MMLQLINGIHCESDSPMHNMWRNMLKYIGFENERDNCLLNRIIYKLLSTESTEIERLRVVYGAKAIFDHLNLKKVWNIVCKPRVGYSVKTQCVVFDTTERCKRVA